jgi:hypothetical protein
MTGGLIMSMHFLASHPLHACMFVPPHAPSVSCVHVSLLRPRRDEHYGFQLYQSDPSGNYGGWKAVAIGAGAQAAQNLLKTEYKEETTVGCFEGGGVFRFDQLFRCGGFEASRRTVLAHMYALCILLVYTCKYLPASAYAAVC